MKNRETRNDRAGSCGTRYLMKKEGAEDLSFNTIIASGLNSSMPHARIAGGRDFYFYFLAVNTRDTARYDTHLSSEKQAINRKKFTMLY